MVRFTLDGSTLVILLIGITVFGFNFVSNLSNPLQIYLLQVRKSIDIVGSIFVDKNRLVMAGVIVIKFCPNFFTFRMEFS